MKVGTVLAVAMIGALSARAIAAQTRPAQTSPAQTAPAPAQSDDRVDEIDDQAVASAVRQGVEHLLAVQEGPDKAEWPYEGVYRVRGEIPIGYRIGGTAIGAMALLHSPGYADDPRRREAVERAARFIIDNANHPLMSPDYDGGYDVRGWGYTYGLTFLLNLKAAGSVPDALAEQVEKIIRFFIDAIQKTEIAEVGGWNYARQAGRETVSPPSPFMTAPTVQALFEARRQGYEIDASIVNRALDSLEKARTPSGAFRYSGVNGESARDEVPGAIGRMVVSEATLQLAGRSSVANVRGALDAFIVHWEWLNKRRARQGTHMPPYGIAPYYFYFAHYYAAQAIELLPQRDRDEYRRRLRELLFATRDPAGTWNDRVFERSSNYGTAMSMMALMMQQSAPPARWKE